MSASVHERVFQIAPLAAADAKAIEGQAAAAAGDALAARLCYQAAVMHLTGVGADRDAAELWFELAGLLETIGDHDAARAAYRSAAASTGLRSRPVVPAAVSVAIP